MDENTEDAGRRSMRLKGYDYSQAGGYSITIVTQLRECFFGKICTGEMILSDAGRMVYAEWMSMQERFPYIEMDLFQVMPNHLHGIIIIHSPESVPVGAGLVPALAIRATTRVAPTLGEIVGAFKSITTHKYIQGLDEFAWLSSTRGSGSAITTNTSCVTRLITNATPVTSWKTRSTGIRTKRIPEYPREMLLREIEATDGQIDRLVYGLYGLTEEEIKIVEGG